MTSLASLRRRLRRPQLRSFVLTGLACLVAAQQTLLAVEPRTACTSNECRQDAVNNLPLEQLDAGDRMLVQHVLNNTSIYRRVPTQVIDCDPHLYLFLVQNPEVIVQLWRVMGLSKVSLDRTGENTFRAADGEGTVCNLKMMHASHDKHLVFATGSYNGPLLRNPVQARVVLFLRSSTIRETNGRQYVTCKLDAFIHLERGGLELLARAFQSLLGRSADMNFAETMGFVSSLSRTAEVNPEGTGRIARRLNIDQAAREQFAALAEQVAEQASNAAELRRVQHEAIEPPVAPIPRR